MLTRASLPAKGARQRDKLANSAPSRSCAKNAPHHRRFASISGIAGNVEPDQLRDVEGGRDRAWSTSRWRRSVAEQGGTINAVAPGFIETQDDRRRCRSRNDRRAGRLMSLAVARAACRSTWPKPSPGTRRTAVASAARVHVPAFCGQALLSAHGHPDLKLHRRAVSVASVPRCSTGCRSSPAAAAAAPALARERLGRPHRRPRTSRLRRSTASTLRDRHHPTATSSVLAFEIHISLMTDPQMPFGPMASCTSPARSRTTARSHRANIDLGEDRRRRSRTASQGKTFALLTKWESGETIWTGESTMPRHLEAATASAPSPLRPRPRGNIEPARRGSCR